MIYEIIALRDEFAIAAHGRQILRVGTLEEAYRLMADVLDEERAKVVNFRAAGRSGLERPA